MATYEDLKGDALDSAIQSNITAVLEKVNDPRGRKNKSDFIYQADPRTKSTSFSEYPIIYIEDYSYTLESVNAGGNLFRFTISAEIHVVAEDDGAKQKKWHDDISGSLTYMFHYGQRTELSKNGVGQPEINRNDRLTGIDVNDQPVIRREFNIEMPTQIDMDKVSA